MAALVCIVCSVGVNVFQIVRHCVQSDWTIRTIIDTVKESHNGILTQRYLQSIEHIYEHPSIIHSIGIECFACRSKTVHQQKMFDYTEGYVQVDEAVEAFEVISNKVNKFRWNEESLLLSRSKITYIRQSLRSIDSSASFAIYLSAEFHWIRQNLDRNSLTQLPKCTHTQYRHRQFKFRMPDSDKMCGGFCAIAFFYQCCCFNSCAWLLFVLLRSRAACSLGICNAKKE